MPRSDDYDPFSEEDDFDVNEFEDGYADEDEDDFDDDFDDPDEGGSW